MQLYKLADYKTPKRHRGIYTITYCRLHDSFGNSSREASSFQSFKSKSLNISWYVCSHQFKCLCNFEDVVFEPRFRFKSLLLWWVHTETYKHMTGKCVKVECVSRTSSRCSGWVLMNLSQVSNSAWALSSPSSNLLVASLSRSLASCRVRTCFRNGTWAISQI